MNVTTVERDGVMLKRFEFENSYCFRERVNFDLSAEMTDVDGRLMPKDAELGKNVRYLGGSRGILPVAAIYGKNAGGKTKLIKTLHDMAKDALGDTFKDTSVISILSPFQQIIGNRAFRFARKRTAEIKYSVCVLIKDGEISKGAEYQLQYTIGNDGFTKEKMERRGLRQNDEIELLYDRDGSTITPGVDEDVNASLMLMENRNEKRLWFSQIAQSLPGLDRLYEWFQFMGDGISFNETNHQEGKFSDIAMRIANGKDEPFRLKLLYLLKGLDKSVVDIAGKTSGGEYRLWIYHRKADDDNGRFAPKIINESAGTRKLIEQFPLIDRALRNGMPFICDEFDRMLHPIVFKQLVKMFNTPKINDKNAQLIFTAHDTIVLDSDLLRRDEVHIVDKDERSVSSIKRLSEMGIAPYADMENDFRTNVYGSFPENFIECYRTAGESGADA